MLRLILQTHTNNNKIPTFESPLRFETEIANRTGMNMETEFGFQHIKIIKNLQKANCSFQTKV